MAAPIRNTTGIRHRFKPLTRKYMQVRAFSGKGGDRAVVMRGPSGVWVDGVSGRAVHRVEGDPVAEL
ncbi:hypothetical protein AB0D37_42690, partial [Streptomyces sp. NPDC048384]|uniref:hypothetical protein n=1 Tax=Streptomyces sp. NPDC048384 TaxID=3155487 RepID=UPI00343127B5